MHKVSESNVIISEICRADHYLIHAGSVYGMQSSILHHTTKHSGTEMRGGNACCMCFEK